MISSMHDLGRVIREVTPVATPCRTLAEPSNAWALVKSEPLRSKATASEAAPPGSGLGASLES